MTITGQSSMAKDDIERMMRDAEAHAEEDRRRREEAETRNQGESLVYQTDKLLRDSGEKLEATERGKVEVLVEELKDALKGEDIEAIRTATDALMGASQEFSQKLYEAAATEQAQAAPTAGADDGGAPGGGHDDVVDAEIVDEEG